MKYIEFTNEDGVIEFYSIDEFVSESWYLPFDFVLMVANKHEEIRDELMGELLLRAYAQPYTYKIIRSKYYNSLKNNIITGNDINKKVHLLLYFEPQLLYKLFNNVDNLVNTILLDSNDKSLVDIAEKFVKISTLYNLDNDTLNNMIYSLESIADNECNKMAKFHAECSNSDMMKFDKDKTLNNIIDIKDRYIDVICYNKLKYSKIKKLH